MKLRALVSKAPPYLVNHSYMVELTQVAYGIQATYQSEAVQAHTIDHYRGCKDGHICQIVAVSKEKRKKQVRAVNTPTLLDSDVKVSCNCEFFMYYCEYALNKHGAANIRYCNGEAAVKTNPDNYPLMCKHLLALSAYILKHSPDNLAKYCKKGLKRKA